MSTNGPRYRKVHSNMWGDKKFTELSDLKPSGKALWIYLLTGPETGIIPGVLRVGKEGLSEALNWTTTDMMQCFGEIESSGMAMADWTRRIIYLPNGAHYNPPANPNVARAWRKEFDLLPECEIVDQIWSNVTELLEKIDNEMVQNGKEGRFTSSWMGTATFARNKNGSFAKGNTDSNGQPNSSANGSANGYPNGSANGSAEDSVQGIGDQGLERTATEVPNHSANGSANGFPNSSAEPTEGSPSLAHKFGQFANFSNGLPENASNQPNGSANGFPNSVAVNSSSKQYQEQKQEQDKSLSVANAPACASHRSSDAQPAIKEGGVVPSPDVFQLSLVEGEADPVFCEFPVIGNNGATYKLRESKVREYEETYPGIDVRQEIRSCRQWDIDNPTRRKSATGILSHISKWVRMASDSRADRGAMMPAPVFSKPAQPTAAARLSIDQLPEVFRRFWMAYPAGKGDMMEVFQVWDSMYKTAKPEEIELIIKGVNGWAKSDDWLKDSGRFIPNPARFLREERWRAAPPGNRHFGIDDADKAKSTARFNGMTLREIQRARAQEKESNLKGNSAA